MIASGVLSGGLSSSIAGGSFADGFRQGIITAGLNHAMHGVMDDGELNTSEEYQNTGTGEKHILFKDQNGRNKNFVKAAQNTITPENTIDIYGHGSSRTLEGNLPNDMHTYLLENSDLYQVSINEGKHVNIRLFACLNAKYVKGENSFAFGLSKLNKNATITASSTHLSIYKNNIVIRSNGRWYDFNNGLRKTSNFNSNFNNGNVNIYHESKKAKWNYRY